MTIYYLYACIIEQNSPEPKVKASNSMYEPLELTKCKKCGKIIAEPKELIRIQMHACNKENNTEIEITLNISFI